MSSGVAVDGRAEADHRLQRRRLLGRHLQAIEAAPGNAHHADIAVAPGLRSRPGDDVAGILQFLLGIFVVHQPFGIAIAPHVDADRGVAVPGEIGMGELVAKNGAVALAVGQVFEDGRYRTISCVLGHPDARRQPATVRHDDAHIGKFDDFSGERGDGFHGPHNAPRRSDFQSPIATGASKIATWVVSERNPPGVRPLLASPR